MRVRDVDGDGQLDLVVVAVMPIHVFHNAAVGSSSARALVRAAWSRR